MMVAQVNVHANDIFGAYILMMKEVPQEEPLDEEAAHEMELQIFEMIDDYIEQA